MTPQRQRQIEIFQATTNPEPSRQGLRLRDLPREVLDDILLYILPDPRDIKRSVDRSSTRELFTNPVLQACAFLRQKGLRLINHKCIWIHLRIYGHSAADGFTKYVAKLPAVPKSVRYLIDPNAASLCLSTVCRDELSRKPTRRPLAGGMDVILPYNFVSLVGICSGLSELTGLDDINPLTIKWRNVHGARWKEAQDFVLPALLALHDLPSCVVDIDCDDSTHEIVRDRACSRQWTVGTLTSRVIDFLQNVDKLTETGHKDEASALLWSSAWIMVRAGILLPPPATWSLGEFDEDADHDPSILPPFPGRCPSGNRLRSLVHQIEHKASLGYVHLLRTYGREWCFAHETLLYRHGKRFDDEPAFTWFGLTVTELGELHYGRALVCEELGRKVSMPSKAEKSQHQNTSGYTSLYQCDIWPTQLRKAAEDMYTAYLYQPHNEDYRSKLRQYRDRLGEHESMAIQKSVRKLFLLIEGNTTGTNGKRVVWGGSIRMLYASGGPQAMAMWLSLAQKGLEISPTVEEWVNSAFPEREKRRLLRRGRMLIR